MAIGIKVKVINSIKFKQGHMIIDKMSVDITELMHIMLAVFTIKKVFSMNFTIVLGKIFAIMCQFMS